MKTTNFLTSSCRHCRYYQTEGRRGGTCQQLGVPVQAHWKACTLAAHPFTSAWESLEDVVHLENSFTMTCSIEQVIADTSEATTILETKQPATI